MGLKTFTVDFDCYRNHQYLRFDPKYWIAMKNYKFSDYSLLKDVFELINGISCTEYYSEEKTSIPYIRSGILHVDLKLMIKI